MNIEVNIFVIISFMVIAQGLFASSILGFSSVNKKSNRILALLLLSFSLWLIDTLFKVAGVYNQNPNLYFLPIFYSFAFGPLIYFYVKSLTNSAFEFQKKDWLHFIPVFIQGGLYWFLTFKDYSYKRWFWQEVHFPVTYDIEFDLTLLSLVIYLILSVSILTKYQAWLKNNFSEYSKIHLNWLRILLLVMLILSSIWTVDFILRDFFHTYPKFNFSEISLGAIVILLAYGGIRQSNISNIHFKVEKEPTPPTKRELDQTIISQIKSRMKTEKDFLHPTLTLQEFATALKLPPRIVSEHINQGLNISFVDFVNQYRIQAFKEKVLQGRGSNYTILALALESGFNSKSSFNRVFKKGSGQSPSEFVKEVQNAN